MMKELNVMENALEKIAVEKKEKLFNNCCPNCNGKIGQYDGRFVHCSKCEYKLYYKTFIHHCESYFFILKRYESMHWYNSRQNEEENFSVLQHLSFK